MLLFSGQRYQGQRARHNLELLETLGKEVKEEDKEKLAEYRKEQREIEAEAREREEASEHHLKAHNMLASAVTLFQVAIALATISVLTRKRALWPPKSGYRAGEVDAALLIIRCLLHRCIGLLILLPRRLARRLPPAGS